MVRIAKSLAASSHVKVALRVCAWRQPVISAAKLLRMSHRLWRGAENHGNGCSRRRRRMRIRLGRVLVLTAVAGAALYTVVTIQSSGAAALFRENRRCCQLSFLRNVRVTLDEIRGLTEY